MPPQVDAQVAHAADLAHGAIQKFEDEVVRARPLLALSAIRAVANAVSDLTELDMTDDLYEDPIGMSC